MLTKREEYIKTFFIPTSKKEGVEYMSENEAEEIVKKISDIGNRIGFIGTNVSQDRAKSEQRKHKYDVWIAKEAKKDLTILDRSIDIRLIIDWAYENKVDLFSHTFESAYAEQAEWHSSLIYKYGLEDIKIPELDNSRIVFRFSDNSHFLYLLKESDLAYEGAKMGHCVGSGGYTSRIRNKTSIILSLRDKNNEPHATIEIQTSTCMVVQQQGKGNKAPIDKYLALFKEFVMYSTNFTEIEKKDVLKVLNPSFN